MNESIYMALQLRLPCSRAWVARAPCWTVGIHICEVTLAASESR